MEYTWENGVTTLTKNENIFYRAVAGLRGWSTSSDTFFTTELGLCRPRGTSSDKNGISFLQSWGWAGVLEHQLQHWLGSWSSSSNKIGRLYLQSWGSVDPGAPAPTLAGELEHQYRQKRYLFSTELVLGWG